MPWLETIRFGDDGLIPVVAQDASTGDILMLAYANRTALEETRRSGQAHYWSRSRGEMWRKGATSGHTQEVVEIRVDCDGDALIYRVLQTGPACHTLERSCFFRRVGDHDELVESPTDAHILARVDRVIESRMETPEEKSYTNYLLESGVDKILKKVGEETTEVVIAAKNDDPKELRAETADLLFHVLVLLRARGLPLGEVWAELEERFGRAPRSRRPPTERKPAP